jgi:hypothetical protein
MLGRHEPAWKFQCLTRFSPGNTSVLPLPPMVMDRWQMPYELSPLADVGYQATGREHDKHSEK